jgi:hypothetical protein
MKPTIVLLIVMVHLMGVMVAQDSDNQPPQEIFIGVQRMFALSEGTAPYIGRYDLTVT